MVKKSSYTSPDIEIVPLDSCDIVTTSVGGDHNWGEWD